MNAVAAEDFWSLLRQSRLFSEDVCDALETEFERTHGERRPDDLAVLTDWLVEQNALTEYQSLVLRAGRSGPFFYGDYKVYDRVAQGALAGTFRAVHVPTSHLVTLQFLRGEALTDAALWKTIVDRSLKLATVRHPFVLPFLEPVDLDTFKFLVYEDPGSLTVRDWLRNGPMDPIEVVRVVRDLAMGLDALHSKKTTAADFRPERIFTTTSGAVRILVDPSQKRGTFAEMAEASPEDLERRADYLAPEFSLPTQRPDPRTDIYALGCLAFEMLTARPPFQGGDVTAKLERHAQEPIAKLEPLGVPKPIAKLVAFMMAKNPDVRIQTADDLKDHAQALLPPDKVRPIIAMPSETAAPFEQWIKGKRARLARAQREKALAAQLSAAAPVPARANAAAVDLSGGPVAGAVGAEGAPQLSSVRKKRVSKKLVPAIAAGVCALLFAIVALIVFLQYGSDVIATGGPGSNPAANGGNAGANGASGGGANAGNGTTGGGTSTAGSPRVDDGRSLFASPTSGDPITLELVPPGAQMLLCLRPAGLMADPRTSTVLENDGLGPDAAAGIDWIETATAMKFDEIDRLVVAIFPNGADMPRVALRVDPVESVTRDDLLERWKGPDVKIKDDLGSFSLDGRTFVIPNDSTRFLVAAPADAAETLTVKGAPPLMRREMEELLATTDVERDVTLLFAPNFFFGDGRKLFSGTREKLVLPLADFLGDGIQAGSLSLHVDELFYVEMRLASEAGLNDLELAEQLKARLEDVPRQVEDHVVFLNPSPYWRKVAFRYADMIAFLYEHTRVGTSDRQATLNAYLPPQAAADLAVGTELVVNSAPSALSVASAETPEAKGPTTIEEALEAKITLQFASDSLEFSVDNVKAALETAYPGMEFDLPLRIVGPDLQLNGITRNQSIRDFDMQDATVADVLTEIAFKANTIKTVKDVSELDQKLIWVVANDPDSGEESILFTTRDAAEKNGYELPERFIPKEPPADAT